MGGGEIALLNLVRALDPYRYYPVVVLFAEGPLAERLREAGVETHVLALDPGVLQTRKDAIGLGTVLRGMVVFRALAQAVRLARFIRQHAVDLVHANSLKADIIGCLAGRLARVPVIWHVRDRIADDYLPPIVARAFRLLSRVGPTFVIANSEATLTTLRFADKHRTAAIYSGIQLRRQLETVDEGRSQSPQLMSAMPAMARGPTPLIGLVGRITRWKGQDVFLRAAAEVRRRFPQARFQIIGAPLFSEQDYEREVRELARSLGLEQAVEFTGFRSDVPELVSQLDVLVHASTTGEPFGQVVVEGMAAGKPVVATNGGGIPEIVVDGVTGLLVPMGDHRAMAAAVCHLLAEPALAAQMGQRGRERVLENFTIEHTVSRVQEVYDTLLGNSMTRGKSN